jgi:TRAP-type C4-dicarboxylate transport system permease small subunit
MTALVSILFILLLIGLAVFVYDLWRNYLAKLSCPKPELAIIIAVFVYFILMIIAIVISEEKYLTVTISPYFVLAIPIIFILMLIAITKDLDRSAKLVSKWIVWVGGAGVIIMLALTVVDIIGVKIFNTPVPGSIEIVAFLGVVITAFGMAFTQAEHGNIQVEFFVTRLPERIRAACGVFTSLMGITLFAILAWQSVKYGISLQQSGEVSMTSRIPFYPFVYAIAFCCIPVCFVLLVEMMKYIMKVVNK